MPGQLVLVGTPIGNLGDITQRAIETLRQADRIYAEDTRRTRALLSHLGLDGKRLLSLHAHSPERDIRAAVEMLEEGKLLALVTDAGMPAISDPGAQLVRAARDSGVTVSVVPGPSAVTAAVALSGLVDGGFCFLGFLPRKGSKRQAILKEVADSSVPTIIFESPHRVSATLTELCERCEGTRKISICREITKRFEETIVGTLAEVSRTDFRETWQGEFTLVIDKSSTGPASDEEFDLEKRAAELLSEGSSLKDCASILSKEVGRAGGRMSRRVIYQRLLELRQDPEIPDEDEG